jgi:protein-tyrosine phosphatase
LGSYENATNKEVLNRLKISHVLTVAAELDLQNPSDLVWRHIRVNDTTGDDIAQHLSTAFQFIDEAKIAHGRVLVHCAMGISRSSSVVIGYLIKHHEWSYDQAYDFVKVRRSTIKPNAAFVTQLKLFSDTKTLTTQ